MSDFEQKLAALRQRYVDRRDAELAALEAAARDSALDVLGQRAHSLAGSSAVFGFAAVGEAARALEQALGGADGAADWSGPYERLVDELRKVA